MEIRPIIGWRNPQWEFIVNPIVDLGFGTFGDIDFLPAARLARSSSASAVLHDGQRFAKPGLSGFSSNSCEQIAQVRMGNAIS